MTYRSDKLLVQDLFFPFNLTVIALESIRDEQGDQLGSMIRDEIRNYMSQFGGKSICKIAKRVEALTKTCITDLVCDKKLNGHKFILTIHALAELVVSEGIWLPEFIEKIFIPFFDIEEAQKIDEDEWLLLKKSANKQARKIFSKLQDEGFFLVNKNN